MNGAIIVMTILGCGQGNAACDYVRTVETPFASKAACESSAQAELMKTGSAGYPEIIAICEPPHSEIAAAPSADLPGPVAEQSAALAAPKVVAMPDDLKPKNPIVWTVDQTRKLVGGVRKLAVATWKGLASGLKPKRMRQRDPILLSQYVSEEF